MMCTTSAAGKTIDRLEEEEDATIEHTVDNVGEEEATQDENEEWVSAGIDPSSGKEYYYNRNTGVLVELVDDEVEEEQTMEEWIEAIDAASGNVYYYNSNTGVMSWTKPVVDGVASPVVKVNQAEAVVTQADEELLIMDDAEADYEHQTESKGGAADNVAESGVPPPADAAVDEVVDDATAAAAKVADTAHVGAPAAVLQDEVDNEADKEAKDGQEVVTDEVVADTTTEPSIDNAEEDETCWVSAGIDPTSGKEYYYNPNTGVLVKIVDDDEVEEEQSMEEWVEAIDATSGKVYYYNLNTGVTSWTKPVLDGVANTPSKSKVKGSVEQVEDELPMEDHGEDEQTKLPGHSVAAEVDIDNVVEALLDMSMSFSTNAAVHDEVVEEVADVDGTSKLDDATPTSAPAALLQDDDLLCRFLGLGTGIVTLPT